MKTTKGKDIKCTVVPIHVMKTSRGGGTAPPILNLGLMQISGHHHPRSLCYREITPVPKLGFFSDIFPSDRTMALGST
jgi:hypothetical protein